MTYKFPNHYRILNVHFGANQDEIKQAYRKKARETHPDVGGSQEEFINVRKAYDVLSNPERKRHYDSMYRQYYQEKTQEPHINKKQNQSNHQEKQTKQEDPMSHSQSSQSRESHSKGPEDRNKNNIKKSKPRRTYIRVVGIFLIVLLLFIRIEMTDAMKTTLDENISHSIISKQFESGGDYEKNTTEDAHTGSNYTEEMDVEGVSDVEVEEEIDGTESYPDDSTNLSTEEISDFTIEEQENDSFKSSTARSGTFSLGSTQEEVKSIMGAPASISSYNNSWNYELSSIYFSSNNKVIGWSNISKNLKAFLGDTVANATFTLSSSKQEVVNAMGTPTSIPTYGNSWDYEFSTIYFNSNNKVIGWSDISNNLKAFLGDAVANTTFTLGSSKQEVVNAMGTPTSIPTYSNSWDYEFSTVHFNSNNQVIGWSDISNNLRAFLGNATPNTTFTLGSSKQEVIEAMGTPTSVSSYDNSWDYNFSTIRFDDNNNVVSWSNISENLRIR